MNKNLFLLAILFVLPFQVLADEKLPSSKIIGLIEIPKIFGLVSPQAPPTQVKSKKLSPVTLHTKPERSAPSFFVIKNASDVVSREHGYEESSAVAVEQQNGWTLIQSSKGKGWLSPDDSGKFRSYESLVKNGLDYLTADWDRRLYASSDNLKVFENIPAPEEEGGNFSSWEKNTGGVKVLESRTVGGQLWFYIQLVDGLCDEEKPGKKGWIPGYSIDGKTTLWFHSRGC